jgi:hypothetical protein
VATGLVSVLFGFLVYFVIALIIYAILRKVKPDPGRWVLRVCGTAIFPSFSLAGLLFPNLGGTDCLPIHSLPCASSLASWPLVYGSSSTWVLEGPIRYAMTNSFVSVASGLVQAAALGAWLGILELFAIPGIIIATTTLYPLLMQAKNWMMGDSGPVPNLIVGQGRAGASFTKPRVFGTYGGHVRLFVWVASLVFFAPLYFIRVSDISTLLSRTVLLAPVIVSAALVSETAGLSFGPDVPPRRVSSLILSAVAAVFGLVAIVQGLTAVPSVVASYLDESFAIYALCLGLVITTYYGSALLARSITSLLTLTKSRLRLILRSMIMLASILWWLSLIVDLDLMQTWSNIIGSDILGLGLLVWLVVSYATKRAWEHRAA